MKLISAIPDGLMGYNCSKCNGLCCNLNSTLVFNSKIVLKNEIVKLIGDYITFKNDNIYVSCGKKCWFLNNDRCSLEDNVKPIGCKFYP